MPMKRIAAVGLLVILAGCSTPKTPDERDVYLDRLNRAELAVNLACNVGLPLAKTTYDQVAAQIGSSAENIEKAKNGYDLAMLGCTTAQGVLATIRAQVLPK